MIETKHTKRGVEVFIPYDYFDSSYMLCSPSPIEIINKGHMLQYMKNQLKDISYGSAISEAIDQIVKKSIEENQHFLKGA